MIINHNMASLNTYRQMSINETNTQSSLQKLSSGLRINKAGDDAAGLAISEKMRGQIRGLDQASRNSQDAISLIQTAEGSLSETHSILQRMRELSVQASNDTNTETDRGEIQKEINQLTSEVNRIGNSTEFNSKKLLNGSVAVTGDGRQVTDATYTVGTENALKNVGITQTSTLATGDYEVTITNDTQNEISSAQNSGITDAEVLTAGSTTLDEGSYKIAVKQESVQAITGSTDTDGNLLNDANGNEAIKIAGNSNLTAGTYNIDVTKTVDKTATGSNAAGISALDVSAFDDGARFDISVDTVIDKTAVAGTGLGTVYMANDTGAISNLSIAGNSTYAEADNYKIKVTQLGDTQALKTADLTGQTAVDLSDDVLTIDVGGGAQAVTLTNVQALGAAYDAETNIAAVATALQNDINAVFDGTANGGVTFTVNVSGNQLEITSNQEELGKTFTFAGANDLGLAGASSAVTNTTNDVKMRFDLTNDTGSGDTVVQSAEATFTGTAGAQTIDLGDISFDVNKTLMFANDANKNDATAGSFSGKVIDLSSDAIKTQVSVSKDGGTAVTQSFKQDGSDDGIINFDMDPTAGTKNLTMTIDATALAGGQTQTTTVDVNTSYAVTLYSDDGDNTLESGEALGSAATLTEADLADPDNLKNIALGAAGNGIFLDLDSTSLSGMAAGSKYIDFTVAAQTTYTAEVQDADGTNGQGSKVLNGAGDNSRIDLGNGVVFEYDKADVSADGDVFFSVKAGVDNYKAQLTNTTTSNNVGDAIAFNKGDKIDFGNGVTVETASSVVDGDSVAFTVEDATIDNSLTMQVGANAGQTFSVDVNDMRADALDISSTTASATKTVKDSQGNNITASYRATTDGKEVTNGTDSTGTEYALDVSTATKATAAIKVLDEAINNVSAERSKLGAFQNRLEHTIANLGTSSENLTAAESRIRDVDMAKEMMNFQKNNILQQAAQAMLAQANQQPQGVLQLLR